MPKERQNRLKKKKSKGKKKNICLIYVKKSSPTNKLKENK